MKILFITGICSKEKYEYIYRLRRAKMIDPSQKFFDLLLKGMIHHKDIKISCLTSIPVSASTANKKIWRKEIEKINDRIEYIYLGFINGKFLRYITLYINSFINTLKWLFDNWKETKKVVICDPLLFMSSKPARIICKLFGIKSVAIITDVPIYSTSMKQRRYSVQRKILQKIFESFSTKDIFKYDSYIFLVDNMNNLLNKNKKPFLIIEGSVDINMQTKMNYINKKEFPRVIMYAGGVYEKFGVKNLIGAFQKLKMSDVQLHIYGSGNYIDQIVEISRVDPRIKYRGVLPVEKIIEKEITATLLVNPRPSKEEFAKYSFPSKILEYMVSGTPVITTKLSGIPKEYYDYLLFFDDESIEGMSNSLEKVLQKSDSELHEIGVKAKEFVLANKNNIIQGKKIIDFIETSVFN